jgi:predicted RNase H-like HicB family nuclease
MRETPVVVYQEADDWVARALSVDISSFGQTAEEALAMIREALELYFEGQPDVDVCEVKDPRLASVLV